MSRLATKSLLMTVRVLPNLAGGRRCDSAATKPLGQKSPHANSTSCPTALVSLLPRDGNLGRGSALREEQRGRCTSIQQNTGLRKSRLEASFVGIRKTCSSTR